jgi:hypothetical protein
MWLMSRNSLFALSNLKQTPRHGGTARTLAQNVSKYWQIAWACHGQGYPVVPREGYDSLPGLYELTECAPFRTGTEV